MVERSEAQAAIDTLREVRVEVAAVRRHLDLLIWGFPLGCAVVIATSAVFRYVG
ncbi:MAG: hypothetical protein OXH12_11025 [Chloroflexi bacterium]|nr:hypothetical protein [Chloroflexota bacterium]MCY3603598.1 hypothetical protein [Chloroflexota bacterium]